MEKGPDSPCCALALAYTTPPAQPMLEQRPARPGEEGPAGRRRVLTCPCTPWGLRRRSCARSHYNDIAAMAKILENKFDFHFTKPGKMEWQILQQ